MNQNNQTNQIGRKS